MSASTPNQGASQGSGNQPNQGAWLSKVSAAAGWADKFIGVAGASIGKATGTAIASVSKIIGVS